MRIHKNYRTNLSGLLAIFILLGLIVSACDIDDSINNSPNAINEEAVKSSDGVLGLTISLQVVVGDFYQRDRSRAASIWTWQMCAPPGIGRPQVVELNSYVMAQDGPVDDMWILGYRGMKIASDIIRFAPLVPNFGTDNEKIQNTIIGMAKTYKAMLIGELAANYGSIPIEIVGLTPPTFVSQKDAYAAAQILLTEALTHFSDAAPLTRDLNFGGNGAKWTEVVHSLKARYFLHLKDYTNALAHSQQGISDPANTLFAMFSDKAGEYASWGHWVNNENEPIRADYSFIRLLKREPGDNRLAEYFHPGADAEGEFYGFAIPSRIAKYIATDEEKDINKCARMKKYSSFAENFPLISFSENVLIRAEAKAQTGNFPGAIEDVDIIRNNASLPDYTGQMDPVSVFTEIMVQKHIELYLEGQTYHDMRRLGVLPDAYPWDGSKTNLRWIYPESERNANPNVPADADNLVEDLLAPAYGGK